MNDNQKVLLECLKDFDKFCRDNKIEYFIGGGTALGAVRHRGFLPWDDDVDMYMKASEWERCRELVCSGLPEKYTVTSNEDNEKYGNPIIRIVNRQTTTLSRAKLTDGSAHGVYLEIFLLDTIPDDEQELKRYYEDFWIYCELLSPTMAVADGHLAIDRSVEEKYMELAEEQDEAKAKALVRDYEKRLFGYDEDAGSMYHLRWGRNWVTAPKWAFRQKYVPFEDTELPVPEGFPDVFFAEYGDDWMEIPEMSMQETHDTVENYGIPYELYEESYSESIEQKSYRRVQKSNKNFKMQRLFCNEEIEFRKAEQEARLLIERIKRDGIAEKCGAALEAGELRNAYDLLEEYYAVQKRLFGTGCFVEIEDELLHTALYLKMFFGDLKFVEKVRRICNCENRSIRKLFDDLKTIREIRFSYFYGKAGEHIDRAIELEKDYPGQVNLCGFIYQYGADNGDVNEEMIRRCSELIAIHRNNPRLMKAAADMTRLTGNIESAKEMYEIILSESNDGMVNLEIKDIQEAGL